MDAPAPIIEPRTPRTIVQASSFRRDLRREARGEHGPTLAAKLKAVLQCLVTDTPLPARYRDHALAGSLHNFRDCHIKPDLVLICAKPDQHSLLLLRLGSHSALRI